MELSKAYHEMQIGLYIKYKKEKLMKFLEAVEAYNALEVSKLCFENGMYREFAFLQTKIGNKEDAIRILIDTCETVTQVIDFAIKFNLNEELLWARVLEKTAGSTSQTNELMAYIDHYSDPGAIIMSYGPEVTYGDIKHELMSAFKRIFIYQYVL